MGNQRTFASMAWNGKGKVTRRERFLAEMDAVIPWPRLIRLIEPHYPKAGQRSPATGTGEDAADLLPAAVVQPVGPAGRRRDLRQRVDAALCPGRAGRGGGAGREHDSALSPPTGAAWVDSGDLRFDQRAVGRTRLLLRSGTIVDATIIAAPSSTKNASATRDPEMKQTRKGKNWYFGMKLHIGTDPRGIVHTVRATDAGSSRHHPAAGAAAWAGAGVVRGSSVLEGRRSSVSRRLGGALLDQPAPNLAAAVERALAADQSGALADPGARRTRLSGGQATVGLRQSKIPRSGQEPGARADHVCAGQPLPGPQTTAPGRSEFRVVTQIERTANACDHLRATKNASRCCLFA